MTENNDTLLSEKHEKLIKTLKSRFEGNMNRHKEIVWDAVQVKLEENTTKLWSLSEMERTGGEPDVIGYDNESQEYIFCDCSVESPKERRSICYDRAGLESRKKHQPENSAIDMATSMGIELLTEEEYRELQALVAVDLKTSSWIQTPLKIRELGGALFCDRRYDHIFVYHNGASSYYSSRGFRGLLRV